MASPSDRKGAGVGVGKSWQYYFGPVGIEKGVGGKSGKRGSQDFHVGGSKKFVRLSPTPSYTTSSVIGGNTFKDFQLGYLIAI